MTESIWASGWSAVPNPISTGGSLRPHSNQGTRVTFNLDLLERENLIGRLKLIELLERQSPYREMQDRVERRFSQALTAIPHEFLEPALAVFSSTLYLTKQMLEDAWRFVWSAFCREIAGPPGFDDLLVLELDRDLLRDDFYRANSIVGRLQDNLPVRSTHDIIDTLMQLESDRISPELRAILPSVMKRPYWVLLIDLSMSGSSAISEIARLHHVRELLFPTEKITICALIQVVTEPAAKELQRAGAQFVAAIEIPQSCALNTGSYSLVTDPALVAKMKELCTWFGRTHVLPTDYRLARLTREHGVLDIANFGFDAKGRNIESYKNTPNNSLPILWFRPPDDSYRPPFERIDSRIGSSWGGRSEWLERVEKDENLRGRIREALKGIR